MARRILELGEQQPYEKEPSNAWVFRVLDLDPSDYAGFELRAEKGFLYYGEPGTELVNCGRVPDIGHHVFLAIESWMKFGTNPDDHAKAVSIVIHNRTRDAFLLQRKDLKHPNMSCQGRYSLFGGSPHMGEDIYCAALRELLEEIRFKDLGMYLAYLKDIGSLSLDSVQWPGRYTCHVQVLDLPNDVFDRFVHSIAYRGNISESIGAMITRQEFEQILLPQELASQGQHFVASHHAAIDRALKAP